ncbi:TetR/AcrR family transcriptional regulator [Kibdelosporangium philippinense]|uniref:TetR/AcrR family transcriptional regulator n=1 Tax=Kibdelosporangium philippinense TaxID=211113 RepID=A0ABS8ZAS1_9PSEU|nr:TetR/AcrR family transcriptional regulator [Kibdelosporangium philippinense]MCE7004973.1 TetR/AcrR family transcriptional regulator [Kibdelosporangium philippinense]
MPSRAETQERNRRALITAAIDLIAAQGYRAATVEAIAAKADLTTGAVYSAFGGKRELFLAAIQHCRAEQALALSGRTPVEVLRSFGAAMAAIGSTSDARRLFRFELELAPLVLRDQVFAQRLDTDPIVDALAEALGGTREAERVAMSAAALARGLLQQWLLRDAEVDVALVTNACASLAGLLELVGPGGL